jgi:hypothetical protein
MLVGFGVGYSWGACIVQWDGLGGEIYDNINWSLWRNW